jgi:hypothetical protein
VVARRDADDPAATRRRRVDLALQVKRRTSYSTPRRADGNDCRDCYQFFMFILVFLSGFAHAGGAMSCGFHVRLPATLRFFATLGDRHLPNFCKVCPVVEPQCAVDDVGKRDATRRFDRLIPGRRRSDEMRR